MSTNEKILDRIKKLHNHAESAKAIGSEAEAQAFADQVQRMLLAHDLELADIAMSTGPLPDEPAIREKYVPRGEWSSRRSNWQEILARAVAEANQCSFMVFGSSNVLHFVGYKRHVETARYAMDVLVAAADRMAKRAYDDRWRARKEQGLEAKEGGRGFCKSWLLGFVMRLLERAKEVRRQQETEKSAGGTCALVLFDKARKAIADEMRGCRKAKGLSRDVRNAEGYQKGTEAANRVNLNQKGISGASQRRLS